MSIPAFYTSETDVLLALNGCYAAMKNNNAMGEESDLFTDQRSDDDGTNDNQSNAGEPFQFNNFSLLVDNYDVIGAFGNSVITVLVALAISLSCSTLAAYALVKLDAPGKRFFIGSFVSVIAKTTKWQPREELSERS